MPYVSSKVSHGNISIVFYCLAHGRPFAATTVPSPKQNDAQAGFLSEFVVCTLAELKIPSYQRSMDLTFHPLFPLVFEPTTSQSLQQVDGKLGK